MSTERIDMKVYVDVTDAMKKATEAWRAVARLANPQLSEEELDELARAEPSVDTVSDETDT